MITKQFFLIVLSALALIGCAGTPTPSTSFTPSPTLFATIAVPPSPTVPQSSATSRALAAPTFSPTKIPSLAPATVAPPTSVPTAQVTAALTPTTGTAQPLEGMALVHALQSGGFTIVFRHAITDQSQTDVIPEVLEDCAKQRNLSEQGRMQAREIGSAIAKLKIPIGIVLTSPYCRTRETALLAFGRAETTPGLDNAFVNTDRRPELQAALRQLVAQPPTAGTNTVLVTHGDNMTRALGVSVVEGEALIVLRDGSGGFIVVARVTSAQWQEFAAQ